MYFLYSTKLAHFFSHLILNHSSCARRNYSYIQYFDPRGDKIVFHSKFHPTFEGAARGIKLKILMFGF